MDVSCPDNYADGHFDEVKHLHKPAVFLESEMGK